MISPQYIYANDFETGIAFVARGEWTIDPKWDNAYKTGRYWTEDELWGAIDPTGAEVIPCIFDEIKRFEDCTDYFMAHYGGWENGHWGVIDRKGSWVAEPIFADIDYAYHDGLFAFMVVIAGMTMLQWVYTISIRTRFCSSRSFSTLIFSKTVIFLSRYSIQHWAGELRKSLIAMAGNGSNRSKAFLLPLSWQV